MKQNASYLASNQKPKLAEDQDDYSLDEVPLDSSLSNSSNGQPKIVETKLKDAFLDYLKDDNPITKEDQELVDRHAQMFGYVKRHSIFSHQKILGNIKKKNIS